MPKQYAENAKKQKFGRRKDVHRIIIAKGNEVTSVNIHPIFASLGIGLVAAFLLAYLGATGYLMFRDDIIGAANIRQVRLQNAYEDQLANLRIEIDRIASRQMLDQKSVENKLDQLLGLRASLDKRERTFENLTQSANAVGIIVPTSAPHPRQHPARQLTPETINQAAAIIDNKAITSAVGFAAYGSTAQASGGQAAILNQLGNINPTRIDLNKIEQNLHNEEISQVQRLKLIAKKTADKSKSISSILRSIGATVPGKPPHSAEAIGGPFEEAQSFDTGSFNNSIEALEENFAYLNKLERKARRFPLRPPVVNAKVSSRFGRRVDPFLGRQAMHSGVDFKAPTGTKVYSTGPGKVIKAGWQGGYGRMVEVLHADGVTTRYAHLSRINVKVGSPVNAGTPIGRVGSSGRSTGPHLHYETRIRNKPVDPNRFLRAGNRLKKEI